MIENENDGKFYERRIAIEQGYDMEHPLECPAKCYWGSNRHGSHCPQGGCQGYKLTQL